METLGTARPARHAHDSPEYDAWLGIRRRCHNPSKPKDRANYADRGIYVCDRWMHSFENFLADMGKRPSSKYSLDRIDNDGPYSPENCRWATRTEQENNKRTNVRFTLNGRTETLVNWCRILNLNVHAVRSRIRKGWTQERAFGATSHITLKERIFLDLEKLKDLPIEDQIREMEQGIDSILQAIKKINDVKDQIAHKA